MGRRISRATKADMVALLRAQGGFSVEEVAAALNVDLTEVDGLSVTGDPYKRKWTPQAAAREVLRFRRREGRWPTSTDFRDWDNRRMGLPSWGGLTELMCGWHPQRIPWGQGGGWRNRATRNHLQNLGTPLPAGPLVPQNGWVALQWYMAFKELIRPTLLLTLPNALIRRLAMEAYGVEQLCRGHAREVATDRWGTLWQFPVPKDALRGQREPTVYLEVENKTPEPDGTLAHYFLRVPPDLTVPRLAVAWTFGITGEEAEKWDVAVET